MLEIKGKYNTAKIFTENIEDEAKKQIMTLCDQKFTQDSKIRIMPDVHAGAGCTIGTTMTIKDKVVPNLVGVDIGCGMEVVQLLNKEIDFKKLDNVIRENIPFGFHVRTKALEGAMMMRKSINELKCVDEANLNVDRALQSIGTLGGGNHFIEIDQDDEGILYLVIHSGSRHLGVEVAKYYQNLAYRLLDNTRVKKQEIINAAIAEGCEQEIEKRLKVFQSSYERMPKELSYLENQSYLDYLMDMIIVQKYADINRKMISEQIIKKMDLEVQESFSTIHNYIDIDMMILRKGAVSAKKGEKLLIPMNMRDGSLICIGKGNPEWNFSAPHGAGRLFSRSQAKRRFSVEVFKEEMSNVYSTTVSEMTLDESPMAYKPMEEIIKNIKETADVKKVIKPVYNFKAD
ncbi:RtcB family protein [Eubacterium limosum]|uniref:RtcB family protein n=1 Tax=Eubacterium limosum TaxID=1736 RepID=UPI0010625405|nr:RtcB family protein [Eubacterium limosum]